MIFSGLGYVGIDILFIELVAGFDKPATILILPIEKGCLGIVFLQMCNIIFLHVSVSIKIKI